MAETVRIEQGMTIIPEVRKLPLDIGARKSSELKTRAPKRRFQSARSSLKGWPISSGQTWRHAWV